MVYRMKLICTIASLVMIMTQVSEVESMSCDTGLGISMNCPILTQSDDAVFCCYTSSNIPYCCDLGDYLENHKEIIGGVAAAAIVLLLAIIICCCCCCSCCLLAKRRQQRGTVFYGPVSSTQPATASYPVQPTAYTASPFQQASVVHSPPPYSPHQPAFNPSYSQNP